MTCVLNMITSQQAQVQEKELSFNLHQAPGTDALSLDGKNMYVA